MLDNDQSAVRRTYAHLSDDDWIALVKRSSREPIVGLPGFPPDDMQRLTVGSANEHAIAEASNFYRLVKAVASLRERSIILDFGVSWGRIIRLFMKDVDADCLYGVDVKANFLDAARSTRCPGTLDLIDPRGVLPHESGLFDVVYAYSIFTHLPDDVADIWLAEIARVTKPSGVFIATVQPPRFIDRFLAVNPDQPGIHPWHARIAKAVRTMDLADVVARRGYAHIPQMPTYGDSIVSEEFVRQRWSRFFEVCEFLDDHHRFTQAVVTCRPR